MLMNNSKCSGEREKHLKSPKVHHSKLISQARSFQVPDCCREKGEPDGLVSWVNTLESVFVLGLEKSQVDFT